MAKGRPGVMLYFDMRPCLRRLTCEEKGLLLEGLLDYAQLGVIPDFDGGLGVAWDFIQPRIDRDWERYQEVTEKRRQAADTRWEKERQKQDNNANAFFAMQTMPTTAIDITTTPTPNTNSSSTPNPASTPTPPSRYLTETEFERTRRERMKMLDTL